MTQQFQRIVITTGDDSDFSILLNTVRCIDELTINPASQRRFGQTRADIGSDIHDTNGLIELTF